MNKKKISDLSLFEGKKLFKVPVSTSSLAKPDRKILINLINKKLKNPENVISNF